MITQEIRSNAPAEAPVLVGEGVKFERIRRITGYLVGTVDRFNNGKRAEEHDRVKHSISGEKEII